MFAWFHNLISSRGGKKHSLAFNELIDYLSPANSANMKERMDGGLSWRFMDNLWESERDEAEELIWSRFLQDRDLSFAPYMLKLRNHNGVQALSSQLAALERDVNSCSNLAYHVLIEALLFNATYDGSLLERINRLFTFYSGTIWDTRAPEYLVEVLVFCPATYKLAVDLYLGGPSEFDCLPIVGYILHGRGVQKTEEYAFDRHSKYKGFVMGNFNLTSREEREKIIAKLEDGAFDKFFLKELDNKFYNVDRMCGRLINVVPVN